MKLFGYVIKSEKSDLIDRGAYNLALERIIELEKTLEPFTRAVTGTDGELRRWSCDEQVDPGFAVDASCEHGCGDDLVDVHECEFTVGDMHRAYTVLNKFKRIA
ncbi:MAG: hypothetical protein AAF661_04910 [Pseudomonadota bacterium]